MFFLELFLKEGKKGNERNYSHYNSNFIENLDNIFFLELFLKEGEKGVKEII